MNATMNTNTINTTTPKPVVLRQDTVAVAVTINAWCRLRTVQHRRLVQALEAQKDTDRVAGRVLIAKSAIIDEIEAVLRRARLQIRAYCVPVESLKLWLARESAVQRIVDISTQANASVKKLAESLAEQWSTIIENAKAPIDQGGLGELFNPAWFPPPEMLPNLWAINAQFITVMTTTDTAEQLAKEARTALRQEFYETLKQICARLLDNQRLRSTTFEPLRAFIATFSARDVAGDSELAQLIQQAQALVSSPAAYAVKGADEDLRQYLAEQVSKLAEYASKLPERSFED